MGSGDTPASASGAGTLNGWKEIAAFLGKSVRSVQRWEVTLGLPVHRIRTPDGQIVYGVVEEIEEWRRRLDTPPVEDASDAAPAADDVSSPAPAIPDAPAPSGHLAPVRLGWRQAATAALLLALGVGIGMGVQARWRKDVLATRVDVVGRAIEGYDSAGVRLWAYDVGSQIVKLDRTRLQPQWADVDGDHEPEAIVAVRFAPVAESAGRSSDAVYCLTRRGALKWKVVPMASLTFGAEQFGAPWKLEEIAVADEQPTHVWAVYAHHTWWPGFVLEIDGQGSVRTRFVQAGRLYTATIWQTPTDRYLAIGGMSRETDEATVSLLPMNGPDASFPVLGATPLCQGCPQALPAYAWRFPGNEVTHARGDYPWVSRVATEGTGLKVNMAEAKGATQQALIGADLHVESFYMTDGFKSGHNVLERAHILDHPAWNCPEYTAIRTVQAWQAASGTWRAELVHPLPRPK